MDIVDNNAIIGTAINNKIKVPENETDYRNDNTP